MHNTHDDRGLENVEYAIIAGLIISAVVASVFLLAPILSRIYHQAQDNITGSETVIVEEVR